ncbi:DUF378 domain-containing protein [uncultured Tyzzerella sp.]|uniref:DUF378 domain-containing protein n=1 Tax=uncultured Tyzzerella sp. TaxID=2321398 RepID=UPI0029430B8F|nr:DUF378 domain-containing protein [uncultured Tyzzerella sp.]
MQNRPLDWTILTLVVIGAINWGLIGFFKFDLVATLFGGMDSMVSRIVYALVGLAGLYCITLYAKIGNAKSMAAR